MIVDGQNTDKVVRRQLEVSEIFVGTQDVMWRSSGSRSEDMLRVSVFGLQMHGCIIQIHLQFHFHFDLISSGRHQMSIEALTLLAVCDNSLSF